MSFMSSILTHLQIRTDDDFVDRLNYFYTSSLMILFAVLVSAKQYVGYPIQCWVPARFTEAMEQYTENYCWIQNTWWHPLQDYIPKKYSLRDDKQLVYYQWIPFILALEACLFFSPAFFWRLLNFQTGVYVEDIVQMAKDCRPVVETHARLKVIVSTAHYLEDALTVNKARLRKMGHKPGSQTADMFSAKERTSCRECYVTVLYFGIKTVYCLNLCFQYFLLDYFLGTGGEMMLGPKLLKSLMHGREGFEWKETGLFPRVTLCDFEVKVMGNLHRHTVQCVLMINMFNEKIFITLWFWFAVLLIVTFLNLMHWIVNTIFYHRRKNFVVKYLRIAQIDYTETGHEHLRNFINGFIKIDGLFVLRLIGAHAGDIILTEILAELWYSYARKLRVPGGVFPLTRSSDSGEKEFGMDYGGIYPAAIRAQFDASNIHKFSDLAAEGRFEKMNGTLTTTTSAGSVSEVGVTGSKGLGVNPLAVSTIGGSFAESASAEPQGDIVSPSKPKSQDKNIGKGVAGLNADPTAKLANSGTQWAVAGSRILQKQVLNPMPIYKQHHFMRMEKKKGQY